MFNPVTRFLINEKNIGVYFTKTNNSVCKGLANVT